MPDITILATLEHVKHVSTTDDIWKSKRTVTERQANFPVEIQAPEKAPAKTIRKSISCPQCGEAFDVIIRSRIDIWLSWIWNALLWTAWAIPLLFIIGKLISRSIEEGDLAILILLVPLGFIYLILPTNIALHMTANTGRLNFTQTRSLGVDGHYLYQR
ncbi:MAG: hypothetical protein K8S27_15235 [Candidatus Omnitrophica bacterium]|nr:hypothetical protein [Candidatus Omnitrophota bacterium]